MVAAFPRQLVRRSGHDHGHHCHSALRGLGAAKRVLLRMLRRRRSGLGVLPAHRTEGARLSPSAPLFILAGYLFMHLFNRFITAFVCDRPATEDYALGLVPMLGIGIHSFIDGIVYTVTFSVSAFMGVLVSIGMVLHEFPEGLFTYVLLRKGGFQERAALWAAVFAAALTTPLGTLISFPIVSQIDQPVLAALLALSAGALIYVGASHLLPTAEREPRRYSLLALGAGVLVALGIIATHG
jgi:zinc and cadmium transporter